MLKINHTILITIFIIGLLTGCSPVATETIVVPTATQKQPTATTQPSATATQTLAPTATPIPATPTQTSLPTATHTVEAGKGGKIAVGIVIADSRVQIYSKLGNEFKKNLKLMGYSASILYSQSDTDKEYSNVETLINQGIKVLIICSVDEVDSTPALLFAKSKGVKIIAVDRLVRYTDRIDYYISFDNIGVGKAQAQYLVDHAVGKSIPLFVYAGSDFDNNAYMFFDGAWQILQPKLQDGTFIIKNSNEIQSYLSKPVLARSEQEQVFSEISISSWNPDEAKRLAISNLQSIGLEDKGDVAILAPNDGTSRAIFDIFKRDKDVTSILITGQDAESASLQSIRSGKQSMTVFKDVRVLAKESIDIALALLTDQAPVLERTYNNGYANIPYLAAQIVVIDKDNVDTATK